MSNSLLCLVKRNFKIFFKDKGMFLSSLITPLILFILYVTFLANVYRDSFEAQLPAGFDFDKRIIEGFIGGFMFSSLLAVCTVTIAFSASLLMIQDKYKGTIEDLTITPVKKSVISMSYYISTLLISVFVCYIAMIVSLIYLAIVGFYLSFGDVMLIALDVILLSAFGTSLACLFNFFFKTEGQKAAFGVIVNCIYGFICGAYMPISQFGAGIGKALSFFPGTYGTSLVHYHFMDGVLDEMVKDNIPIEAVDKMRDNFDVRLSFFGHTVPNYVSYIILIGSIIVFTTIYILLNKFYKKNKVKHA